ncbi:hypothetical protein [Treponema sp.]|uniref:hypothetical protein n=1 Tax=Treponema sp. TaxID=166 RepID=UPI00388ECAF9
MNNLVKYKSVFIVPVVCLFLSCENFLSGGELKERIEKQIEYSNSSSMSVHFVVDNKAGTIKPTDDKNVKITDSFDISYIPADNFVFKKWNVFEYGTNKELRDVVSFADSSATTKITVLKYIPNGITITPSYYEIPNITEKFPNDNRTAVSQDSSIFITFNYALELSDFYNEELDQFKNIEISAGGKNLIDNKNPFYYFTKPKMDNGGRTLIISINSRNLIIPEDSLETEKEITVTLLLSNISVGGNTYFSEDKTWTYRINKTLDKIAPEIRSFKAYKTLADGNATAEEMENSQFTDWTSETFKTNHTSQITVVCTGYDAGGGIKNLFVREQLIKLVSGTDNTTIVPYEYTAGTNCFTQNEDYIYSAKFSFPFQTPEDGILKLEFGLEDYAGNKNIEKTYYVVKDTLVDDTKFGATGTLSSETRKEVNGIDTFDFTFPKVINKSSTLSCIDTYYGTNTNYYDLNTVTKVAWGYDKENLTEIFPHKDGKYKISKNAYAEAYIQMTIEDALKNSLVKTVVVPSKANTPRIKIKKETAETKLSVYAASYVSSESQSVSSMYCYLTSSSGYWHNNPFESILNLGSNGDPEIYCTTSKDSNFDENNFKTKFTVYAYARNAYSSWYLFGCDSDLNVVYNGIENPTQPPSIDEVPYKAKLSVLNYKQNVPNINLKVTLYNENDTLYTQELNSEYKYLIKAISTKDWTEYYCDMNNVSLPSGQLYRIYTAIRDKDGNITSRTNYTNLDLSTYDTTPPAVEIRDANYMNYAYSSGAVKLLFYTFPKDSSDLKNTDGVYQLQYYFIPGTKKMARSSEEIEQYPCKTTTFTKINGEWPEYILLPFDDMPENDYNLYVKIEDNSPLHNYTYVNALCSNKSSTATTTVYSDMVDGEKHLFASSNDSGDIMIDYLDNKVWRTIKGSSSLRWYIPLNRNLLSNEENKNYSVDLTSFESKSTTYNEWKDKFIKISIKSSVTSKQPYFGNIVIAYPKYYLENIPVKRKNVITGGLNGIEVMCDAPVLVHTMYCSKNLGSNPTNWVTKGIETGLVVNTEGEPFTYEKSNYDFVPSGAYYTIIVHFADGKMIMTDVKQK